MSRARRTKRGRRRRAVLGASLGLVVLAVVAVTLGLWFWTRKTGPSGAPVVFHLEPGTSSRDLTRALAARGLLQDPRLFELFLRLTRADSKLESGVHVLRPGLAPLALMTRLTRSPTRPVVKLPIPEGFNRFQIAERLMAREITPEPEFLALTADRTALSALGVEASSAEGYLFPATYELRVDSDPLAVLRILVQESFKRFRALSESHAREFDALRANAGWGMHEVLTLASIVEKEAAQRDEQGPIASVFFNRLNDPSFRPRQMLQSDPTAAYGCLIAGESLASCRGYTGSVLPAMLRDPNNEYNTYKRAGLPPGPIANPGESAILAVLAPPQTPYYFFVANRAKRHVFSRTFSEHERAIGGAPDGGGDAP
jgi:UPF0755 protein